MKGSCHYDKKAKRYFIQVYWQGEKHRFWKHPQTGEPFWDKRTADKQLNRIRTEVDDGTFNPKFWKPDSPMSLANYADGWLNDIDVAPKTLSGYKTAVKHIKHFFGDKDIRTIRYRDIIKFHNWLDLSDKTKYNHVSALRTLLRFAWRNEDIPTVPPFPTLSFQLPEIDYLTFEQQEMVIAEIPTRHRPIFQFMQEYGVRPGEARALQKDCIKDGLIVIKRSLAENTLQERTKTGSIRKYEQTDYIKVVISSIEPNLSPFVFTRDDGKFYTSKNLNAIWKKACKKVGIKIKMYNAFRHSLGCQLLDQGEDLDLVRQQLGHTKVEMTRRYAKRNISKLTDALKKRRGKVIPFKRSTS
jgi:integrase